MKIVQEPISHDYVHEDCLLYREGSGLSFVWKRGDGKFHCINCMMILEDPFWLSVFMFEEYY